MWVLGNFFRFQVDIITDRGCNLNFIAIALTTHLHVMLLKLATDEIRGQKKRAPSSPEQQPTF